jgi:putative Holliday junction resolvase
LHTKLCTSQNIKIKEIMIMVENLGYKGIRIGAIDYGMKRVGFAVCDEFHITISPKDVFNRTSYDFFEKLQDAIIKERVGLLIVGVPYRLDNVETALISEILLFVDELKSKTGIEVLTFDESFSTHRSVQTMLEIGKKKKKRAVKGNKDKIAAAIILRDFLEELEGK